MNALGILLAATIAAGPPQLPDANLTPGAVNPKATLSTICVPGYTARAGVRHVTASTKRKVFAAYGINPKVGGPYEIDHLISLELGGSNDPANLWPESYASQPYNARLKDALENRLHALVCAGKLSLGDAQTAIRLNWIDAYRRFVQP